MTGPTTEVLSDDLTQVRGDLYAIDKGLAERKVRVDVAIKVAVWGLTRVGGIATTGLVASAWWGATITSDLENLDDQVNKRLDRLDSRFDRLEVLIEAPKPTETPKVA